MIIFLSSKSIISPESFILRASRSGCQAIMPSYLPFLISSTICLNFGLISGSLALADSKIGLELKFKPSLSAKSLHSANWSLRERTCLSEDSLDFRQ
ncbi:MAG: hypothetical protein ABIF17_03455 [Patescibacteria group bacterium]